MCISLVRLAVCSHYDLVQNSRVVIVQRREHFSWVEATLTDNVDEGGIIEGEVRNTGVI
jgi:hypothetical protein